MYATSGAQLIAGMTGFGQWQERVLRVMRAAPRTSTPSSTSRTSTSCSPSAPREAIDIPGAIPPFLEEGRVRVLGELTPEALDLLESRHPGLFAALEPLRVEPLAPRHTREALSRPVAHDSGSGAPAADAGR